MASKSKSRRRVFRASCILAALIIAGSSFAWFTSKDEVTNRLSANANYGAAIVEDFTPPENFLPGQKVNKDVGVVNTGNIDAIVRTHLKGAINILKENAVTVEDDVTDDGFALPTEDVTDDNLIKLGLTKRDDSGNFYRTLSVKERTNPQAASTTNDAGEDDGAAVESSEVNEYSEVEAIQAGGYLAYAEGAFKFTPETAGYTYRNAAGNETITQTAATELTSAEIKDTWTDGVGLKIDSDTFTPTETGLYIFRRNVTESNTSGSEGTYYEYSGYYYDNDNDLYYALHYLPNEDKTYNSDYVIYSTKTQEASGTVLDITYEINGDKTTPVVDVDGSVVKLFSASYSRVEDVTGVYSEGSTTVNASVTTVTAGPTVTFTYNGADNTANTADDIKVIVNLDNVGVKADASSAETWTQKAKDSVPYFYYNNDVEEGDTTSKLVDSVELDKNTKKSAYLAMDFDLSVLLDSVQVTYDESGNEMVTAANEEWTGDATATKDGTTEIEKITWA